MGKRTLQIFSVLVLCALGAAVVSALFPPVQKAWAQVVTRVRIVGPASGGGYLQVAAVEPDCDITAKVCLDAVSGSSTDLSFPASADDLYEISVVEGYVFCTVGAAPTATINDYPFPQDYVGRDYYTEDKLACRTKAGVAARVCVRPCEF